MYKFFMAFALGVGLCAPLGAADGLAALFDRRSHDFGNVPIGPQLQTTFTLKNTTNQNLRLVSARVSCGCVTPTVTPGVIAPGESATVHANMDTRRFVGAKSVTIFVLFDQPRWEEVSLVVSAYGRTDVSFSPDTLAFGQMRRGNSPMVSTRITFYGNTQITEAAADSSYVQLSLDKGQPISGGMSYVLSAKMRPDIPVGKWFTDVWVSTNQGAGSKIRIPLTVDVEAALQVVPGAVTFDPAKVGAEETKQVVVKGAQPFRILEVQGGDGVFAAVAKTSDAKPVHIVTVTFHPSKEGDYAKSLKILTDMKEEGQVDVKVKGKATP
jgi:hypothetical protein